jgi:hypothetical protein
LSDKFTGGVMRFFIQSWVELLIAVGFIFIAFFCHGRFDHSIAARNLPEFLASMKGYIWHSFWFWYAAAISAFFFVRLKVLFKGVDASSKQVRTEDNEIQANPSGNQTSLIDRASWCCFLISLLYVVLTRTWQFPVASDDSYIDYRYVHNLVRLGTFDYNPGLHVMGFTSHLHLLVLSILCVIFRTNDVAIISQQLNIFCQLISCGIIFRFLSKVVNKPSAALGCLLFAADSYLVTEVAYGKESSIVILFMLIAIYYSNGAKPVLFAWSNSLLFFARPEGVVWMAFALIWHFKKIKFQVVKFWSAPIFMLTGWYCFLFYYFHTLFPHGALAKGKVYIPRSFVTTAIELGGFISNFFAPLHLKPDGHPLVFYNVISALHDWQFLWALIAGILVLGALFIFSKNEPWLRFYFGGASCVFIVFSISNPWMFSWYYAWFSLIPVLLVPLAVSLMFRRPQRLGKVAACVLSLWLLSVPLIQQPQHFGVFGLPVLVWESVEARLLFYREAAEYLNNLEASRFDNSKLEFGKASESAVYEPGIFGYYYNGRVLDLDGLVCDEPLAYYPLPEKERAPKAIAGIPVLVVDKLKPKQILFFDWIGYGLLRDSTFCSHYALEKEWAVNVDSAKLLKLYRIKTDVNN